MMRDSAPVASKNFSRTKMFKYVLSESLESHQTLIQKALLICAPIPALSLLQVGSFLVEDS